MKTRNQKKTNKLITPLQFEEAMAKYADAEKREAEINICLETGVNQLLAGFEQELLTLGEGKNAAFETVQAYCLNNKKALFAHRRSIGTTSGIAGFRLGTPRLKISKGKNWQKLLPDLKTKLPDYIRTIEEPAKDQLLADRHKEPVAVVLIELGIQAVQDEIFFIQAGKAA